jgi:hypothetical protein
MDAAARKAEEARIVEVLTKRDDEPWISRAEFDSERRR